MFTPSRSSSVSITSTSSSGTEIVSGGDLAALGFAGIPAPYRVLTRSRSQPSLFIAEPEPLDESPPPPYSRFDSEFDCLSITGVNWSYSEPLTDDIQTIKHGEVIKAKLRHRLHRLRRGKSALPWDVFLNQNLKEGEVPWAPKGASTWKLTTSPTAGQC